MQAQYTKNPFEQPVIIGGMNSGKVKVKLGQSPDKSRNDQNLDPKAQNTGRNKIPK